MSLPQLNAQDDRVCPTPCGGPCAGCPDRVVCECLRVTEGAILDAIVGLGVRTLKQLRETTEAGTGCNCCLAELREYLEVHASSSSPSMCSAR